MHGVQELNGAGNALENRRYTVVAPTTGGTVWIERIRARPRLQASYAALKGDFRPLALSADYHNFVSGPLAAHGISDGAHELLISDDIDSGRSWEIPVLIGHLLATQDALHDAGASTEPDAKPDIIWATGSVDPELHPQGADYSVARKCELAADLFSSWKADGRTVHVIVPDGMPVGDVSAVEQVAANHGFQLSVVGDFPALAAALGHDTKLEESSEAPKSAEPDTATAKSGGGWQAAGVRIAAVVAALGAGGLLVNALLSDPSTQSAGINGSGTPGRIAEGTPSPITLVRLGAKSRSDCIERIMLTQPMDRTTIAMSDGAYRIPATGGLCGLRFINQSSKALTIRLSGDLITAAIQGNDALFQGVALPANDATNLIFSRPANGLTASLQLDDAAIPVVIEPKEASEQ